MITNSNIKLGIIAFANYGGLGVQTRRLCSMLNPDKVLVVDSSKFSPNKLQEFKFFEDYNHKIVDGFPKNYEIIEFIDGLTHVLTVENPYNFFLIKACKERGIKTICQTNYEFCENVFSTHLPVPDLFLMPSTWHLDDMKKKFNVVHLPPPIDPDEFNITKIRNINKVGKPRFLHIIGTRAWKDRNGTLNLLKALKYSVGNYELVIRSQHELPENYITKDKRVSYEIGNLKNNSDLYFDFDALILPRRYGGLSLTTNEALMSALPVMMPDISPNYDLLPREWLIKANRVGKFMARAEIDYYEVDPELLALRIDSWTFKKPDKLLALKIANQFSKGCLKNKYIEILNGLK